MIDFTLEIPLNADFKSMDGLFKKRPLFAMEMNNENQECRFWGDPIPNGDLSRFDCSKWDAGMIAQGMRGHFYYIIWNRRDCLVTVGNSLFSILPVYYRIGADRIMLAATALDVATHAGQIELSRRFVLETTLFNYPLFNGSVVTGVSLLPSNSFLRVSKGKCVISRHTSVADHFQADPLPWRKALSEMSETFLKSVGHYFPNKHYYTTLTGGFDGRTLTAAGLYHNKSISCYSFGSQSSADITIAADLAALAKIPFLRLELDDAFVKEISLDCGLEFIRGSSGSATFARSHYLHAARKLGKKTEHIVTGNFGSEILRAAHVPGEMISPNLLRLFNSRIAGDGIKLIETSSEFSYLNRSAFKNSWDELQEDLRNLPCFSTEYQPLTRNEQFYVFVFEEVFRKYFGAEMVNQFRYVKNRTPFLDWKFLKAILRTELAGVHSGFFESNPAKRFKGQVLYGQIIRDAFPVLGRMKTDKGYRPDDLLSLTGKLHIAWGYFNRVIRGRGRVNADPFAVRRAFNENREAYKKIRIDPDWFNTQKIRQELGGVPTETLFNPLSLSYMKELVES